MATKTHLVDTVADLTSTTENPKADLIEGQQITVAGYYAAGDKEAVTYVWNAASTATANGGTILAHDDGGTGRFLLDKDVVSVKDFGAVGDGLSLGATGNITSGLKTFTSSRNPFVAGDVGKMIVIAGAGAAGAGLFTTIASVTSAGTVEVTDAASTTVSNAESAFGKDNLAAFVAALTYCYSLAKLNGMSGWKANGGSLFVPSGVFLINISAGNGYTLPAAVRGVSIRGAGRHSTTLLFAGSNYFLYNNNAAGFFDIQDMLLRGVTGSERFMWYYSTGTAQNISRIGCDTYNLGQLYNITGTGNADYNTHRGCNDIHLSTTIPFILIDNTQSVSNSFKDVHVSTAGTYLKIIKGGAITWDGGGIVVNSAGFFVKIENPSGTGLGSGNGKLTFSNLKTELRATSALLRSDAPVRILFNHCALYTRENDNSGIILDKQGTLHITNCDLDYKIEAITDNSAFSTATHPVVRVLNSDLFRTPETLFIANHTGGNVGGTAQGIFEGCNFSQGSVTYPTISRRPIDVHLGAKWGFTAQATTEKVVTYAASSDNRGLPANGVVTFQLPPSCFVTKVGIYNPTSAAKQWEVVGPSGTWLTSVSAQKWTEAPVNVQLEANGQFTVANITDATLVEGFIRVWYI